MVDVVIIGGGIIGCCVARELSKYKLDILLLDKQTELTEGTTKANSGIVHAGYDCTPGSLKAKLNVLGNEMFTKLVEELEIPYKKNGSMLLAFSEEEKQGLNKVMDKAVKNKVPDVTLLTKEQIKNMEPNINDSVVAAFFAPTGGIISSYEAAIAFAESAYINGVKFMLETKVETIKKIDGGYNITTNKGEIAAKTVVNAAGLFSDEINNMVSEKKYKIVPRKGEYLLYDKALKGFVNSTLFQMPTKFGKGILVTPTAHSNLIIGPSAEDIEDKYDKSTNADIMSTVLKIGSNSINALPQGIITSFSGLRANLPDYYDFVVEEAPDAKGFINTIGINSPGLSAAPAIGKMVCDMITDILSPQENSGFISQRKAITIFKELSFEEQNRLIKENNDYGKIVCRCESVTEGEIVEAIKRPLGATTVDGVKRRTRAGSGRCQGGFCGLKVMEILSRELGIPPYEVTKFGGNSKIIIKD